MLREISSVYPHAPVSLAFDRKIDMTEFWFAMEYIFLKMGFLASNQLPTVVPFCDDAYKGIALFRIQRALSITTLSFIGVLPM